MPVFISYSHEDRDFVDRLVIELVNAKASVWLDRWELRVGDSVLDRIQQEIERAEAIIVVLTPASVDSNWCRRELNAATMRELDEAQVLVLPILAENCKIPAFLREKHYADFREDFDSGLAQVLKGVAAQTSTTLGRTKAGEDDVDYALDWHTLDDRFHLRLTTVQKSLVDPYTVITEINIIANEVLTRRYSQYIEAGLDWIGRQLILEVLRGAEGFSDARIFIDDDFPVTQKLKTVDPRSGIVADVTITCRRLGEDTGMGILVPAGALATKLIAAMERRMRPPTKDEQARIREVLRSTYS